MSDELVKLFDGFAACLADKDVDKMMELFAEDAMYVVYAPGFKPLSGKQAIRAFIESELAKFEEYSVKKLLVCEKEGSIVVEWRVHYKDITLNKTFDLNGVTIIEAKEGLIQSMREYIET